MKNKKLTNDQKNGLALYIKLMRATNLLTGRIHGHLKADNLTVSQFAVLEAVYHLGPLSQGELVGKILKSNANLTTVVDSLERKNLVRRIRSKTDRRRINVELTEEGETLIAKVFPRHVAVVEKELEFLSYEEKSTLAKILRKFRGDYSQVPHL